jgi:hypothetical protein
MSSSHDALIECGGGFDGRGLIFKMKKGFWESRPIPHRIISAVLLQSFELNPFYFTFNKGLMGQNVAVLVLFILIDGNKAGRT